MLQPTTTVPMPSRQCHMASRYSVLPTELLRVGVHAGPEPEAVCTLTGYLLFSELGAVAGRRELGPTARGGAHRPPSPFGRKSRRPASRRWAFPHRAFRLRASDRRLQPRSIGSLWEYVVYCKLSIKPSERLNATNRNEMASLSRSGH
ncbi:hypothetical protein CPAR01_13079 [Colletotrichum paranaense]|uniref:Uncharacterized protein n=1 Tax=Colletotrichum paranaense TaxID=1914294 RepID=A0ABQ9S5B4_9PEZI|nr:uncharacterized protein CPAR01_13079 [Colletotrichum paranaense]KAK1526551.1 hypothetical protein CPAR01_13079 [Colletotrichum paranaense]